MKDEMKNESSIDLDRTGVEEDIPEVDELIGLDGEARLYPIWMVKLLKINHDCAVQSGRPPILEYDKVSGKDRILPAAKVALAEILDVPYHLAERGDFEERDITDTTAEDVLEIGAEALLCPRCRDGLLARLRRFSLW